MTVRSYGYGSYPKNIKNRRVCGSVDTHRDLPDPNHCKIGDIYYINSINYFAILDYEKMWVNLRDYKWSFKRAVKYKFGGIHPRFKTGDRVKIISCSERNVYIDHVGGEGIIFNRRKCNKSKNFDYFPEGYYYQIQKTDGNFYTSLSDNICDIYEGDLQRL